MNLFPTNFVFHRKNDSFLIALNYSFKWSTVSRLEAKKYRKGDYTYYPNPFNPSTQIRFSLAESSLTTLEVYSIDGTKVASLVNQVLNAGWHTATFNAANLPTGLYLYRLNTGKQQITKKMLLVK